MDKISESVKMVIIGDLHELEYGEGNEELITLVLDQKPDAVLIDLVVSGHLHGGQIVLPFLGGVSGGEQGWFPEYVHGLYEKDEVSLLITNGLGSKLPGIPRWNNPPEIVVVELVER